MTASGSFQDNFLVSVLGRLKDQSALSVGLVIFTFLLFTVDSIWGGKLSNAFSLYPGAIFHLELNRLSFYLLYHKDIIHWTLNVVGLFTPLSIFEKQHGTVYTGITLNLLTVTAGVQFSLISALLGSSTHVIGLSGVVFLFLSYFAYKEHQYKPILYTYQFQGRTVNIPTLYSPFIVLAICAIILPSSSILGHLAGVSSGYLLALDYLKILYPPLWILQSIELKLAPAISLLDGIVTYYKEVDSVNTRNVSYTPLFFTDPESEVVSAQTSATPFTGEGNVLGTA